MANDMEIDIVFEDNTDNVTVTDNVANEYSDSDIDSNIDTDSDDSDDSGDNVDDVDEYKQIFNLSSISISAMIDLINKLWLERYNNYTFKNNSKVTFKEIPEIIEESTNVDLNNDKEKT